MTTEETIQQASLWDFYAAHALSGILSRNLHPNSCGNNHIDHAHVGGPNQRSAVIEACEIADEMVKQSAKRNASKAECNPVDS